MKVILAIFFFTAIKSYAQKYDITLVTNSEVGVSTMQIQKSTDNRNWQPYYQVISSNPKDTNYYNIPLPVTPNIFYRADALMINNKHFYSRPILYPVVLSTNLINIANLNKSLTFTSTNEVVNLVYYSIEESVDGVNFVEVTKVYKKGISNYKVKLK